MMPSSRLCIAGKNQIAVDVLDHALTMSSLQTFVLPVAGDDGCEDWQPSLRARAKALGVPIVSLDWAMAQPELTFLSVEYEKLVRPSRFASPRLFNIHFSLLPALRGCFTSIWPILLGMPVHGVTLHWIDAGMDTGPIIDRRSFPIDDMNARQIYFRAMAEGRDLILERLNQMIAGDPPAMVQDERLSSTYRRSAMDFSLAEIDQSLDVGDALRRISAFSFPEYQMPTFFGHPIARASRTHQCDESSPGTVEVISSRVIIVSFDGGALQLEFDREWSAETTAAPIKRRAVA